MPAKYFNGMATPSRSRNEAASIKPMARKRPMVVTLGIRVRLPGSAGRWIVTVFSQQTVAGSIADSPKLR
jgi:hypothetical protein